VFISPKMKSKEEALHLTPLYLDLYEDGIIVFDKDMFLETQLERTKKQYPNVKRVWINDKIWY